MEDKRDVFLCHASEDKAGVVRPLFQGLKNAGISSWFDEAEIPWGHSITQTINKGLGISRYVIVVLSRAFLSKNWTQRELNAVLNQEASTGDVRVLPLVVGDAHEEVFAAYPLLNDKRFLEWNGDSSSIINELKRLLPSVTLATASSSAPPEPSIPMPESAKAFSQRDKDQFITAAFGKTKIYFQRAVAQLSAKVPGIEADFSEITNLSFMCSFYKNGERERQCKIWIGSMSSSSQSIYFLSNNSIDPHVNNSFNGELSVAEHNGQLVLSSMLSTYGNEGENMTPAQGSEYLWKTVIEYL